MLLLIVGTLLFNHGGFAYPQGPQVNQSASSSSYSEAFAYSVTSATSLLHPATERPLSTLGEVDEAVLRLFGPALLALGVLSLRGRIKR
jgi:hydrogenase/urease accessory protein HupE